MSASLPQSILHPVTVVTGGSEGIGLELARRFSKAGRSVALVARQPERLQRAADELRAAGATVVAVPLDVCRADAPTTLVSELAAHGFHVDILINAAGTGLAGSFAGQSDAEITRLIDLNITALTRLMRHVLPDMLARGRGGVLNVASLGGFMPGPQQAAYYASKAYVISLTEAVAWEFNGTGVRISVLAPGPVETRFHARMGAEHAIYRRLLPSMSPRRVAATAYWGYRLGCRVIVPGLIWQLTALVTRLVPHILLLPILSWMMRPRPQSTIPNG